MLIERIVNTLIRCKLPEPKYRGEILKITVVQEPLTVHEINSDPAVTRNPERLTLIAQEWGDNGRRFLKWEFLSAE